MPIPDSILAKEYSLVMERAYAFEPIDGNLMFPDLPEFLVKNILPEFIFFKGGKCDILPDFISKLPKE